MGGCSTPPALAPAPCPPPALPRPPLPPAGGCLGRVVPAGAEGSNADPIPPAVSPSFLPGGGKNQQKGRFAGPCPEPEADPLGVTRFCSPPGASPLPAFGFAQHGASDGRGWAGAGTLLRRRRCPGRCPRDPASCSGATAGPGRGAASRAQRRGRRELHPLLGGKGLCGVRPPGQRKGAMASSHHLILRRLLRAKKKSLI